MRTRVALGISLLLVAIQACHASADHLAELCDHERVAGAPSETGPQIACRHGGADHPCVSRDARPAPFTNPVATVEPVSVPLRALVAVALVGLPRPDRCSPLRAIASPRAPPAQYPL